MPSYFTQIIGHNSVNVHRIPTTLGTEICFNELFKCAKFQLAWSTYLYFMADFANVRKVEEKMTTRILDMAGEIFFKFCM